MKDGKRTPFNPKELEGLRLPLFVQEDHFNVSIGGTSPTDISINRLEWAWYEGFRDELISEIYFPCWEIFQASKNLMTDELELVHSERGLLLTYYKHGCVVEHSLEVRLLDSLCSSDRFELPFWGAITEIAMRFVALDLNSKPTDDDVVERCRKLVSTSACREKMSAILGYEN